MKELNTQARGQTPDPLDFELILHWIAAEFNTTDLRTKYFTYDLQSNQITPGGRSRLMTVDQRVRIL